MASKDTTQGTTGKKEYTTLTVPQKLEITERPESGESQREVMASYNWIINYNIQKWMDQLQIIYDIM